MSEFRELLPIALAGSDLGNPSLLYLNCWHDKLSDMTSTFYRILRLRCNKFLLFLFYDCKKSIAVMTVKNYPNNGSSHSYLTSQSGTGTAQIIIQPIRVLSSYLSYHRYSVAVW